MLGKIEWHKGKLFSRVGFIVTNLRRSTWRVVKFYNGRGTAEQWIKEGKSAVKWTRLGCHDFVDNQVRLQLFALAYNLGKFLGRLALPGEHRQLSQELRRVRSGPNRSAGALTDWVKWFAGRVGKTVGRERIGAALP